ncbi:MAG: DUF1385 domain-containing protein [Lachnospiraceae bacterium]|nr:DUF1385 domain-containing protein [Lachnospiraceae bacterium]
MKPSGIGGQAVMEGVMMRNGDKYAVAIRKPDKEITVDIQNVGGVGSDSKWKKIPVLRGVISFWESLTMGMRTLTYSASFYEEEEEKSKFEQGLDKATNGHADSVVNGLTMLLSFVLAIGIFVVLPMIIANAIMSHFDVNQSLIALLEGILRIIIFILYIVAISAMKDIHRLFMYHGAEHKTINCIENGEELTVENVRRQSREHRRCGTSFLLFVMVVSVLLFMLIRVESIPLRLVLRILLIPVIAGISYEFIRFAGRSESVVALVLSRPGMWLQRLTTREPDDSMIEVAIASVDAVFDWKKFLNDAEIEEARIQIEKASGASKKPAAKRAAGKVAEGKAKEVKKSDKIEKSNKTNKANKVNKANKEVKSEISSAKAETSEKTKQENKPAEEPFVPMEIDISQFFDIKLPDEPAPKKKKVKAKKEEMPVSDAPEEVKPKAQDEIMMAFDSFFEYNGTKSVHEVSDENPDSYAEYEDTVKREALEREAEEASNTEEEV